MIKEEANKVTDFIAKSAAALEAKDATIAQQAKAIEELKQKVASTESSLQKVASYQLKVDDVRLNKVAHECISQNIVEGFDSVEKLASALKQDSNACFSALESALNKSLSVKIASAVSRGKGVSSNDVSVGLSDFDDKGAKLAQAVLDSPVKIATVASK